MLREAHDLCGLPVAVFRSDLILAHSTYSGQVNVPDMFTRLLFSLLATGIAPASFYQTDDAGHRPRAHYDGLPVDFIAEAITTLGQAGHRWLPLVRRDEPLRRRHLAGCLRGLAQLELARRSSGSLTTRSGWRGLRRRLTGLPERQRQLSVLPLLHAFREPERPLTGAPAPTEAFHAAVRAAKVGEEKDIPHLSEELINKYVSDLKLLGLL